MRAANPAALSAAFGTYAKHDLHRALDQARCLAQHTERGSDACHALGRFAAKYMETAQNTKPETALLATELAACCLPEGDADIGKALGIFTQVLWQMHKIDPVRTTHIAILATTSILGTPAYFQTAQNFMVESATRDTAFGLNYLAARTDTLLVGRSAIQTAMRKVLQ